jgi:glucan 1,3-beta-glucosidase
MNGGGTPGQTVGSMTLIDSSFTNIQTGILIAYNSDGSSAPPSAGSLILENVDFNNVQVAVQGPGGAAIAGGTMTVAAWGQGHGYTSKGPTRFQGNIPAFSRPGQLRSSSKYYERSKPQYEDVPVSQFVSVRGNYARGNGIDDDTAALQNTINSATAAENIVFVDAGIYRVISTISIPPGARIVGETYSMIMGSGGFLDMNNLQVVVRVGNSGQSWIVEWPDMIVSTQEATAGAILIEWNLASSANHPPGMWDVHTRIWGVHW